MNECFLLRAIYISYVGVSHAFGKLNLDASTIKYIRTIKKDAVLLCPIHETSGSLYLFVNIFNLLVLILNYVPNKCTPLNCVSL